MKNMNFECFRYLQFISVEQRSVCIVLSTVAIALCAIIYPVNLNGTPQEGQTLSQEGICDASGVVDLGEGEYAVADDELNLLSVYKVREPGSALKTFEVSGFLGVVKPAKQKKVKKEKKKKEIGSKKKDKKKKKKKTSKIKSEPNKVKVKEVDIEGAARLNDIIFWITSHGRKSNGKEATERMRLFATSIHRDANGVSLLPIGVPYDQLFDDLLEDSRYSNFKLDRAAEKAPKSPGGLNIEALTDTSTGALYIGFRSPLIDGKALIAPLLNPQEIISEKKAEFGDPILLDLGARGIRGMSSSNDRFLIVANDPEGDDHRPMLFTWQPMSRGKPTALNINLGDLNPEAVAIISSEEQQQILLLSDDGSREIGKEKCKDLKDLSKRRFRSLAVFLDVNSVFDSVLQASSKDLT